MEVPGERDGVEKPFNYIEINNAQTDRYVDALNRMTTYERSVARV